VPTRFILLRKVYSLVITIRELYDVDDQKWVLTTRINIPLITNSYDEVT
jgi:hypothetical protein